MIPAMKGHGLATAWLGGILFGCLVWAAPAVGQAHHDAHPPGETQPAAQPGHPDDGGTGTHEREHPEGNAGDQSEHDGERFVPSLVATAPFVAILLCIAMLPLIPSTAHWWHHNKNKLIISIVLAVITVAYYQFRGVGVTHDHHTTEPGWATVQSVLHHAVLGEYIPFIVLLFSLYTISGGIQLRGDLKATPLTNASFIGAGALMASFIGTTGAAMLLIRPLLQTNAERRYVRHTVIFFIFLVCNIGGSLLPIGDPPLFLGYLRGVKFTWTLGLWPEWVFCLVMLLIVYYVWDMRLYKKEPPLDHLLDETHREPLRLKGTLNFLWLLGVVLSVAFLVPGKKIPVIGLPVPEHGPLMYLREMAQLSFVAIAWLTASAKIREENKFNFFAILEVAALFIGIFITMQVPIEILHVKGGELGLKTPAHFFWATGLLSSFLDNAPTYVVFFETAKALPVAAGISTMAGVAEPVLVGISLGAVFMGANSYIGNGPNFMVKSIAEQAGVKMPSFFGYMIYSGAVLIPSFIVVHLLFL